MQPITIATLLLAAITAALVFVTLGLFLANTTLVGITLWQVRLSRRALDLSIRPLLAEPGPLDETTGEELITFGTPGRMVVKAGRGSLYSDKDGMRVSLPFRNIGAGVAVITDATTDPPVEGDIYVTRKFVPVGEHVRVNVTRAGSMTSRSKVSVGDWWAMSPFSILIHYTDAAGAQALISRADFRQYATKGPYVEIISVFEKGKPEPFAVGRSHE
jgi:hypothetical protein